MKPIIPSLIAVLAIGFLASFTLWPSMAAPRTQQARRNITLSPETVTMLRAHKLKQMELRLALGQGGPPTLVFSTIDGEMLSPNGVIPRKLPRVQFHAPRHTHASTLIRAGVDVLTIS